MSRQFAAVIDKQVCADHNAGCANDKFDYVGDNDRFFRVYFGQDSGIFRGFEGCGIFIHGILGGADVFHQEENKKHQQDSRNEKADISGSS